MDPLLQRLLAIACGGAVGAICRYGVTLACLRLCGERFALGVLLVNVGGCFLLGLLMHEAWILSPRVPSMAHAALTVGFLGALTTFSTFGYDTLVYFEKGWLALAMVNMTLNCGCGLVACWLGKLLGEVWWPAS